MDVCALFLAVKGLPENTWYQYIDEVVGFAVMAVVVIWTVAGTIRSFRRNRFCPNCRAKMELD